MKKKLIIKRRKIFGEKLLDLANYSVSALVLGQLLAKEKNIILMLIGFLTMGSLYIVSYILLGKEG